MNKKLTKLLVGLLTCSILTMPVSAEDMTVSYDSSADGSNPTQTTDCTVEVEKAEIYCVKLPKSVQLDGSKESPTFEYTVEVSGEISSDNYVRVIPLEGGYIETENGDRVDVTVTQDVVKWTSDQVLTGSNTTGEMKVVDLNPGKYLGKVQFFISLDDGYFYQAATCTTAKLRIAEDKNDNGVQDTDEALDTPVAIGRPLGHTYEGEHEFEYNCTRCLQTVYEVSTPEELYDFSEAVSAGDTFENKTITLISDLDMYDTTSVTAFNPIGVYTTQFRGTFDGNGHSISRLVAIKRVFRGNASYGTGPGLLSAIFGYAGNGAEIKNLVLSNSNINYAVTTGSQYGVANAAFVGMTDGGLTIDNCRVTDWNVTVDCGTTVYKGYTAPFIGFVTANSANDRVIINNSCATNYFATFDCSSLGIASSVPFIKNAKIVGWGDGLPCVTVNNSYSVTGASVMSSKAGATVSDVVFCYEQLKGTDQTHIMLTNCPFKFESDLATNTNCLELTDDELKSQTGVNLLNIGYADPVWKQDLLNENNGYPIQIIN